MTGVIAAIAGGRSFTPLAVVASNVTRDDYGPDSSGVVTTTQSPNTTATGGVPPYTWLWTYQSGSIVFDVTDDTLQNPQWTGIIPNGTEVAIWRITVTDAVSVTASFDITVTLTWGQI